MILILGGSGYVGSAFTSFFQAQGIPYRSLARGEVNYYQVDSLVEAIEQLQPDFLINAAGYTGKPNVDACEEHKADCLLGNAVLPGVVRQACETTGLPWGHVSSGCIYSGRRSDGAGFRESDPPNFDFRHNNCSFYSGCKALGEEVLQEARQVYIWRLRIPFSRLDSSRNYLSKMLRYARLMNATNSLSHLDDFVRVAWECWHRQVPFGTYNLTNPGSVTTTEVVQLIQEILQPPKEFSFFSDESEFALNSRAPRSNCVLDTSKIEATGIEQVPVRQAIITALQAWCPEA